MDMISGLREAARKAAEASKDSEPNSQASLHPDLQLAFGLRGRTAVVTGAASGIGRGAAVTFAKAGADVVLVDRDEDGLGAVAAAIADLGVTASTEAVDVSNRSDVDALASRVMARAGRIDVWANVAGILFYCPVLDMEEVELRRIIDVNLLGTYWGAAAALRAMQTTRCGSIINIASAAADMPSPTLSGYGITKAAVVHFTKTLAAEAGPLGVRVNAIAPGWVESPMTTAKFDNDADREALVRERAKLSPLGLAGTPDDVALAMLYLAADASRFVTGQVLRPNGGIVMP